MDNASAVRLADAVVARMAKLRRSRRQVNLRGGPTEPTMLKIERAEARSLTPKTLRKVNLGLDWAPGSAENIYLAAGNPTELPNRTGMVAGPPGVYVDIETITALITVSREIGDLAESQSPALQTAAHRLNSTIQPVYARFITQLLEANRRQDGALGLLVTVLGPFLDRPLDPACDDIEEGLYRRWLAGMRPDIDESTQKRFEARFAEASA